MSKATPRDILSAVTQANEGPSARAPEPPRAEPAPPPEEPPKRRRYREGQRGVLFYLTPQEHQTLKIKAIREEMSLQEICRRAVLKELEH